MSSLAIDFASVSRPVGADEIRRERERAERDFSLLPPGLDCFRKRLDCRRLFARLFAGDNVRRSGSRVWEARDGLL